MKKSFFGSAFKRPSVAGALLVALAAASGCQGSVDLSESESPHETGDTRPEVETGCVPGTSTAPAPEPLSITNFRGATFVGDRIHLDADLDGTSEYMLIQLQGSLTAELVTTVPELRGPARLAAGEGGISGRIRVDEDGAHVEVVDATADTPKTIGHLLLEGIVDPADVYSISDQRLFFCMRPAEGEPRGFYQVSLSSPSAPAEPELVESFLCNLYEDANFVAQGRSWLVTNKPTGYYVQDVRQYNVGADKPKVTIDYGYNQTGVHAYGNALYTSTSELRSVVDPENKHLFLVSDNTHQYADYDWVSFTVGETRRLLGVVDATTYLITPESIRAYDITDVHAPDLTDYEAKVSLGPDAKLLASSADYLLITDGPDKLYAAPRESPQDLHPLVFYKAGETPVSATCP